jgi:chorismate synthase
MLIENRDWPNWHTPCAHENSGRRRHRRRRDAPVTRGPGHADPAGGAAWRDDLRDISARARETAARAAAGAVAKRPRMPASRSRAMSSLQHHVLTANGSVFGTSQRAADDAPPGASMERP